MLKNEKFKEWLEKNKIIYDEKNEDLIKALFSEFIIENETKIIKNIFV